MTDITVIDALMGEGKTTFIHNLMNDRHRKAMESEQQPPRFIYIGPLLAESERCQKSCPDLDMRNPIPRHGYKYWDLIELVTQGQNIASTHQLFSKMTTDLYQLLQGQNYTLVIDEALDVVSQYEINKNDLAMLFAEEWVYVDGRRCLRWNHKKAYGPKGKFRELVALCDNGNLVQTRNGILMWQFPASFLDAFGEVFICTYLFEGQPMADYFKANGVEYTLKTLQGGELVDHAKVDNTEQKRKLADLITVCGNGRMNEVGKRRERGQPLSKSWYGSRVGKQSTAEGRADINQLKNNLHNFFKRVAQTKGREAMWTTFKEYKSKLKGRGYARGFVSINAKATNDFSHKAACAYLVNRFHSPIVEGYFEDMGVEIREDLFALTELVQWIWRSRIRDAKPIHLYIPSDRMRTILVNWIRLSDAEIVAGRRLDSEGTAKAA